MEGSAAARPIGERVAAAEQQLEDLDREMFRVRNRLHDLESDRASIQLLLDGHRMLTSRIEEVAASQEEVAQRTAEKVVTLFYADKQQIGEVRAERRRDRIKVALQAGAVGLALGAFVISLILGH